MWLRWNLKTEISSKIHKQENYPERVGTETLVEKLVYSSIIYFEKAVSILLLKIIET